MSNHSPTPWETDDEFCIYSNNEHIISCHAPVSQSDKRRLDWDVASANMALCSAAPQMLAALKAIERAESPQYVQSWDMAMEQVRAAIKAAEA